MFLFIGGTDIHPGRYHKCDVDYRLNDEYCMIRFIENIPGRPITEICHIDNLLPLEKFGFLA